MPTVGKNKTRRRKQQNTSKAEDRLGRILALSEERFFAIYEESQDLAVLATYVNFNKQIKQGFSLEDAEKILDTPELLKECIDVERGIYNARLDALLKERENKLIARIYKNTNLKTTLTTSITVATIFCLLSPFVGAKLQPVANEICGPSSQSGLVRQAPALEHPIVLDDFYPKRPGETSFHEKYFVDPTRAGFRQQLMR